MKKLKFLNYSEIKPRMYQKFIADTAIEKNTLCILPTGMGKTLVGMMVAADRLEKFPESRILMVAPTRPLVHQHMKNFKKFLLFKESDFIALTGKIHASDRKVFYSKGKLFFATPQLIRNDVRNKILDLSDFSLIIVDECHRSRKKYAYTTIIDQYLRDASNPLILGLTASPGGIKDKIQEVKENLRIDAVEIRTEKDPDVKPYVQEVDIQRVYVKLPEAFKKIKIYLEQAYREKLSWLMRYRLIYSYKVSKKTLIDVQKQVGKMYQETKDPRVAQALTNCAQAIKIEHAIGLLETQGITSLYKYFLDLEKKKKTMATKRVLKNPNVNKAIKETKDLYVKGIEHPKIDELIKITEKQIKTKPNSKIIIFANYRSSVEKITKLLKTKDIEAREFIGQAIKHGKGLKQKEQIEILNEFKYELFNVLVATSVGEEGLDIEEVDLVLFYEPVASEIRSIQRRGRTGRTKPGKVIFLITKDTRDEGYYWSSYHKEKRMKKILKGIKNGFKKSEKKKISDYVSK
jgi:Fanconi anemia group M protein